MTVDADFFRGNRQRLAKELSGGLISITAYSRLQRSGDASFSFEQESNFWYLTGIDAPDWKLVVDGTTHHSWLVMPHVDEVHRTFDGALSAEDAKRVSGVDEVIDADELLSLYRRLARTHSMAYCVGQPTYADQFNFSLNPALHDHQKQLERNFPKVQLANRELAKLRAIKQPLEIDAIKSAIKTTIHAFEVVHAKMSEYNHEYQVEADFSYAFRRAGANGHAYDPIVAAGGNACTLHYIKNQDIIRQRQLVLLDVGARQNGYAADITRTYARGALSKRQRDVHQALRLAQARIINTLEPDLAIDRYQHQVDEIMMGALMELKLTDNAGDIDAVRRYMPHAVSHGLGIDVHDSLGGPRVLQPGMVLTVEPGIYIPQENIGVRIEDDILITENGAQNLSAKLSTDI